MKNFDFSNLPNIGYDTDFISKQSQKYFGPSPEIQKAIDETWERNEEARQATLYTAEHTKQTVEEVARLNSQVSELSTALETERARLKQLEKDKHISEYSSKIPALFWSLLGFIVTIVIFFFENDGLSSLVSIILLVGLVIIHIGAIIFNFIKMQQVKKD